MEKALKKKLGKPGIWLSPATVGVCILTALMVFWLFVFPHGLADNGDFYRVIHNLGLSHFSGSEQDDLFNYFNDHFLLSRHYVDEQVSYFSAQTVFIWLSIQINSLFLHGNVYDIRFLAGLYALIFLVASWILLRLLEQLVNRLFSEASARRRLVITCLFTALYLFIFGDFGYLLYFNSFFGEPLFYVAFLLYIAVTGQILLSRSFSKITLAAYLISALLFIGAKQQGAPLGLVVVIVTLRLLMLRKSFQWRACIFSFAGIIGAVSLFSYLGINGEIQYINQYHAMTTGIMRYETDDVYLKDMNVPPQLMMLKGTIVYDEYPVILPNAPLMYTQMYNRISTLKIITYYLRRPASLVKMLDDVAHDSFNIKPDMVGNYLKSSGKKALAQSYFFSGWSIVKSYIFPKTFGFIGIYFLVIAILLLMQYIHFLHAGSIYGRLVVEFAWGIELMAMIQFATSFIGAGEADLAKHLFYFTVMFDMLFGLTIFTSGYWSYLVGRKKR